ncbi:hypothetical protein, partial [Streptomyces sp. NPDC059916]|uniref:hypothetical protein n=1 Tax=Streptomyces sp. NPDC059916 TaxID=3347001 RepID=UPI0036BD3A5D
LPDAPRPGRPARIPGPEDRAEPADLLDASAATGITRTAPALRNWLRARTADPGQAHHQADPPRQGRPHTRRPADPT